MAVDMAVPSVRGLRSGPSPQQTSRRVISAFAALGEAVEADVDREGLLRLAARQLCDLVRASRCSLYVRDDRSGLYRGLLAHADARIEEMVRRMCCGGETDHFTRELVRTRAPVAIADARHDKRIARTTMRDFGIRSILGVPMLRGDLVSGVFFLDSEGEAREFPQIEQDAAAAFVDLAATAVARREQAAELRARHATVVRQHRALRQVAAADSRFMRLLADGAGIPAIAAAVAELTGKMCAICDERLRPLSLAGGDDGESAALAGALAMPASAAAVSAVEGENPAVLGPLPAAGAGFRVLATHASVEKERRASLLLAQRAGEFDALDALISRRAAGFIALELAVERRAAQAGHDTRAALAAALLRGGSEPADLQRRAAILGVSLDGPHAVCLISPRDQQGVESPSSDAVLRALDAAGCGGSVLATPTDDGVAVILPLRRDAAPPRAVAQLKLEVVDACQRLDPDGRLLAAISSACRGDAECPRAYEEARQVARCLSGLCAAGTVAALTAPEIGPGRLLLCSADPEQVNRFADETMGALLAEGVTRELLSTLACFFANGRSVRRSAAELSVHENTVRYRLGRIEELTGLAVATRSDDQLSAQIALLVLRLRGVIAADGSQPQPAPTMGEAMAAAAGDPVAAAGIGSMDWRAGASTTEEKDGRPAAT